jgi:hypothetical protein
MSLVSCGLAIPASALPITSGSFTDPQIGGSSRLNWQITTDNFSMTGFIACFGPWFNTSCSGTKIVGLGQNLTTGFNSPYGYDELFFSTLDYNGVHYPAINDPTQFCCSPVSSLWVLNMTPLTVTGAGIYHSTFAMDGQVCPYLSPGLTPIFPTVSDHFIPFTAAVPCIRVYGGGTLTLDVEQQQSGALWVQSLTGTFIDPTPEPGTVVMTGIGLLAAAICTKRRAANSKHETEI